jgi:UDP-N-acetylglucosamine 4,6-dehydratase/5-epimerase
MFKNKRILITGGTGSWGNELTDQLLTKGAAEIIIFSRGEIKQVEMQRHFMNDKLTFVIGDVRDYDAVKRAMQGVDFVFHLAALKHVPICENQPEEAIKSNITGTLNAVNAAIECKVKKFIDVSTDKAVDPINLYGMTKGVGERIVIQANCRTKETEFVCIRAGNVIGTNGSVIPYFIKQIKETNSVMITDASMTRFFLPVKKAITLLLYAAEEGQGGEIYVMKMPSFLILDLAKVLIAGHGDEKTFIYSKGAREGEKVHEVLVSELESKRAFDVGNYIIIKPELKTGRTYFHYWDYPDYGQQPMKVKEEVNSNNSIQGVDELKELLYQSGYLK